jgi:hypothetical protein
MIGYSEVLQTMGAMVLFSLMLLSANRMISRNTLMQVEGELEQEVVAVAQDIIEEARTKEFDAQSTGAAPPTNIPEDFTSPAGLGSSSSEDTRQEFNDFDDYNDWKETVSTEHGDFNIHVKVFYVDPDTFEKTNVETTFKKMQVFVTSKFLTKGDSNDPTQYHLEFIRNYYAD